LVGAAAVAVEELVFIYRKGAICPPETVLLKDFICIALKFKRHPV
jgi:hypothetical protein